MQNISRRTAIEAMGVGLGAGVLASVAPAIGLAEEAPADAAPEAAGMPDLAALLPQPTTPAGEMGLTTLTVEQINERRRAIVDAAGEFTREDGTVVSEAYAKLRALLNTYSVGTGNGSEDSIDYVMMLFSEEDAQNYLAMPWGRIFSAAEYAEVAQLDEDACTQICDDLARRGLMYRTVRGGRTLYHQIPIVLGNFEYSVNDFFNEGWGATFLESWLTPVMMQNTLLTAGTPIDYAIPVDRSVVADETILALDDYEGIVERYDTIAVIPCQCRTLFMALNGITEQFPADELADAVSPVCGHPVETCMAFGEEAEFALWAGRGRQVSKEEALAILRRSVDNGMVLQNMYTRSSEFICSCHGDCCGVLLSYKAVGPEITGASTAYKFVSNYTLEYDREACIQCGACVGRCPMEAISIDEDGYPQVNTLCLRCGQCGMVCPASARKLAAKPAEERGERPENLLGSFNQMAGWRMENGALQA